MTTLPLSELAGSMRLAITPPRWDSAACLGADPQLFDTVEADDVVGERRAAATRNRTARRVCFSCPLRSNCLDWAIKMSETTGIWGGTTPEERLRNGHSALADERVFEPSLPTAGARPDRDVTALKAAAAKELAARGMSTEAMATMLNVSTRSVRRYLRDA